MSSLIVEKYLLIASTSIAESTPILHPSNFFPVCLVQFFSQYINMKSLYLISFIWSQIIIKLALLKFFLYENHPIRKILLFIIDQDIINFRKSKGSI